MNTTQTQALRDRLMELTVGGFFFLALAILATFTIILRKDLLWRDMHTRYADFTEISGMKEGDKVMFRGMQIGKIAGGALADDGSHIRLEMELGIMPKLYKDARAEIRSSSVFGGQLIQIEPGTEAAGLLPDDAILEGVAPADVFKQVASFFDKLEKEDVVGALGRSATNLEQITGDFKEGKGTLHKLIHDDTLYEEARAVVTDAREALKTVREAGEKAGGAIDGLKTAGDSVQKAGDSVKAMADNVNLAVTDAREGKGTLGRLMTDETLYADLKEAANDIRGAAARFNSADSTLSKIASDNGEMYNKINGAFGEVKDAATAFRKASDQLRETTETAQKVAARIEQGEGTLGKLANDPALYDEAKKAIQEVKAAVGDFREQAPITTFGTFIFGAF